MKYSGITIEEYRKIKREQYIKWLEDKGEEYKLKLKEAYKEWKEKNGENKKEIYKQAKGGICHCCGDKLYTDLYQHKRSKKHIKNCGNL